MNSIDAKLQTQILAGQNQLQRLQQQYLHPTSSDAKKLKKAAQEFEAVFVHQMLEAMDKTIDRENSILSGGSSEQYWRSMLNEEIAKSMCVGETGRGFGLAEAIYKQLAKQVASDDSSANGASEVK
ncbi:MAG TPA: rod-binding protein [Oculatellaceae cyanobacterium]|jgi:Rod binding domain-containing protein